MIITREKREGKEEEEEGRQRTRKEEEKNKNESGTNLCNYMSVSSSTKEAKVSHAC